MLGLEVEELYSILGLGSGLDGSSSDSTSASTSTPVVELEVGFGQYKGNVRMLVDKLNEQHVSGYIVDILYYI